MIKVMWKEKQNKNLFFHFYVFDKDISLNIWEKIIKLWTDVKNIHMEAIMS